MEEAADKTLLNNGIKKKHCRFHGVSNAIY
jgi:hypothetical protein